MEAMLVEGRNMDEGAMRASPDSSAFRFGKFLADDRRAPLSIEVANLHKTVSSMLYRIIYVFC